MGGSQRFRLSTALKRNKSSARQPAWQAEGNEHKIQHILGITETDLNTARNQSISSSVTAKLPTLSFSDATTELGSYNPPPEPLDLAEDLNLKASSVLLHEEFLLKADVASSAPSKRPKPQRSTSTLNSFYDAQKTPLAISQQTSESSRRDFALRKGAPVVVKSTTPDKDSLRQLKLFRLSRGGDKSSTKKLTKNSAPSEDSLSKMPSSSHRSQGFSHQANTSSPSSQNIQTASKKGVRFNSDRPGTASSPAKSKSKVSITPAALHNGEQVKMNIRRPKAGAKYWFDGLEGDSSEDESVHEPELQPSFVAGIEMAFEGGRIGPVSHENIRTPVPLHDVPGRSTSYKTSNYTLPPSAIPPRVSTLNAKSSRSTLSRKESQMSSPKGKPSSLASTDLHKTSILDLSSSDDDQPTAPIRRPAHVTLPVLRDSLAVESLVDSEIEIGTAKAIMTKQNPSMRATPSLKRVNNGHARRAPKLSQQPVPSRRDPRSTYYSDLSSNPTQEEDELLTSFPPTPTIDQMTTPRPPVQKSEWSDDTASIESRRMMSVTKQEESLLAAIRSKKAALGQSYSANTDPRIQALMNLDRKAMKRNQQGPRSAAAFQGQSAVQPMPERVRSPSSDTNFDQTSCTTFQTQPSNDTSVRYSVGSFRTDVESDARSSFATFSPSLLQPSSADRNRMSRSTFFSTSTNSSRDDSRSRKESHYLATLERLQATPKRDEVTSQDFIDWPYNGWAKVATAH
jgi:hypothetical protein